MIASSRQLEQKSPQLALKLYPLNTDALLAWGIETLGGSGGDTSIEAIGSSARSAIPLNAGDARIYSLVGETMRRQGQDTAAYAMFDHALLLAKTEIHALQWSIQRAVEKRDYREVTNRLDVLFRRWPERIAPLAEALPAVYSNADGYSALLSQLGDNPPWRERLIAALTPTPWDFDPHRLEVLVHRLRSRVRSATHLALPIRALRGMGYLLVPEQA